MRFLAALVLLFPSLTLGQTYTISTLAGGGLPVNIPGTSASFPAVNSVAADAAGNVFMTLDVNHIVVRLDATTGMLTLVAGTGTAGFSGDGGPATSAQLSFPSGVAVDGAGNVYVLDKGNNRVREVSNGVITTVAGNGTQGSLGDNGPATSAQIFPLGIAVDSAGNLYIGDVSARVREVTNGVITTVAGTTPGFSGDNSLATSAQLSWPSALAVDSSGNLYIADGNRIREVSNGRITTVAGSGAPDSSGDNGPATSASIDQPQGIAVDSAGSLFIAEYGNIADVRKVSNGVITTVAGSTNGFSGDNGPATSAQFAHPAGVAVALGNLYIADLDNARVRKVSNGVVTTVAGGGPWSGDNGLATNAQLLSPSGVASDSSGNVYFIDSYSVRKVSNGVITTVAGNGTLGYTPDNEPSAGAPLDYPSGLALDPAGDLYITEAYQIRKVSNGVITTVAGNGSRGSSGDNGPAVNAQLQFPGAIALDSSGNLYISDYARIRKVSDGVITTVAGNGMSGFSGDDGPATSAEFSQLPGIAVDSQGDLYIADAMNNRVRKVSNEVITTVAGGGGEFPGDNGPATSALLTRPGAVAVDSAGSLYIVEDNGYRVRKVSNGVITTIAYNPGGVPLGDGGPAIGAQFRGADIAVDPSGKVYLTDALDFRVRVLTPTGSACSYSVSPGSLQPDPSGGNLTVNIQTGPSCSWTVSGLPSWITISGAALGTGSGSVTLAIAGNAGGTRSATLLFAGVAVVITQQAVLGCSPGISLGGQAFAAAGGSGTITVTDGSSCSWTVANAPSFVTVNGPGSGTGNGTITYQVAANTGAFRSGTFTVGGLSFTVEQASASTTGLTNTGSLAQVVAQGSWTTIFTLVNTGGQAASARLNFFDNNGNPLQLALSFPQTPGEGPLLASTLDRALNPGALLVIQTAGSDSVQTLVGWAQLLTGANISGFTVLRQIIGTTFEDAEVPIETRNASAYVVPFDDTIGFDTGIALANTSAQPGTIMVTVRDDTGAALAREYDFACSGRARVV